MRFESILILAFALILSEPARAESADAVLAQTLFEDARVLMSEGRYAEACPKLEESQRLDPGGGTLLNLAACYEKLGKLATAWSEYKLAIGVARKDGRADREREAEARIVALEPQLSRVRVEIDPKNPRDLEVRCDDKPIGRAAWSTAIPVDPGSHLVTASARGKSEFRATFESAAEADLDVVSVPLLKDENAAAGPEPRVPPTVRIFPESNRSALPRDSDRGNTRRTAGAITLGAGVVSLGVGTYFGLRALSKKSQSDDVCAEEICPPSQSRAVDLNDDARRFALIADVAIGVGLVATGVGTYLLVTSNDGSRQTSVVRVGVTPVRSGALIGAGKTW